MADGPRYKVPLRRRGDNRTDYRSRKALIKGGKPRAIIRKSSRHIRIQIAKFTMKGDRILASAFSKELEKMGWKGNCDNSPGAYLTGYLAGKRCLAAGIEETVLDIGRHMPSRGSVIFSAMKGMLDAGVSIPHSDDVIPSEERIAGKHMTEKAQSEFRETKAKLETGGDE